MQLPGMSTEPVRVAIEVTWWPHDDSWTLSRRGWRRDRDGQWQLEEMATTATPLSRDELWPRIEQAMWNLQTEIEASDDPFSELGAFR